MRNSGLRFGVALVVAIAVIGCSEQDDAPGAAPVPTGGAFAAGAAGGGAGGDMPMPGMVAMLPEVDAGAPIGGMSGAASDAGSLGDGPDAMASDGGTSEQADAGAADSGDTLDPDEDECGQIPVGPLTAASSGREREYGTIEYNVEPPNELIALRTTMLVPEEPPPSGTIFLWPGLQPLPSSANFAPIRNGVLQPVLTWGPSCVPGAPSGHETWWISPVYVNISATDFDYRGCFGGPVIPTEPDALLDIDMFLDGTDWVQQVHDVSSDEATEFTLDLRGQGQARALFVIELPGSAKPTEDLVFTHTVFSMEMSDPEACDVLWRGMTDYASEARVSPDGKHCCIDRIVLRAEGVPATTVDP